MIAKILEFIFGGSKNNAPVVVQSRKPIISKREGLIQKLESDHKKLFNAWNDVLDHAEAKRFAEFQSGLTAFGKTLTKHTTLEDITLYLTLEIHKETKDFSRKMKEEMTQIKLSLNVFFEKYRFMAEKDVDYNVLAKELNYITDALKTRVLNEESKLYPLYDNL